MNLAMRVNPINLDNTLNRAKAAPVVAAPARAFADQLEMMTGLTGQTTPRSESSFHPNPLALGQNPFSPLNQATPAGERRLLPLIPPPIPLAPMDDTDFVPGTRQPVDSEHDRIAATARELTKLGAGEKVTPIAAAPK